MSMGARSPARPDILMGGNLARSAAVLGSPAAAEPTSRSGVPCARKQPELQSQRSLAIAAMPSATTTTSTTSARGGSAIIELSIPMRLVQRRGRAAADDSESSGEDEVTCYICANSFCAEEECLRSMTHLGCCTQAICCGCLLKSSKRCTCKEDCDAVISLCPFCREVSPVEALDVFLGQKPACKACVRSDERAAAAPARPPARPRAAEVIDLTGSSDDDDDDDGRRLPAEETVV